MNKVVKKLLHENRASLESSKKDLKAIYTLMFRAGENVLCETNDGFRVKKYTYAQIQKQICQVAGALYARFGANKRYIALEMENGPDWIVAFWAILMSGNKPYLVNLRYPASLTQGILQTLQVDRILCAGTTELAGEAITLAQLSGEYPAVPEDVFADEIAFSSSATSMNEVICFYTGAQIAEQILNFPAIVKENHRIAAHYKGCLKQLAFLPFYHVFGLFAVYFWFTFFGRTLVFLRDYSADTILKTCRRHQVTHIFAVPMLWHTIEKQVWAEAKKQGPEQEQKLRKGLAFTTKLQNWFPDLGAALAKRIMRPVTDKLFGQSVMFCINGGSYLRDSAMELLNGIGYCMHNGYGMSEIGITSVELRRRPKARNLNSIGHPFTAVEYQLVDGILQVRGKTLCTRKLVNGQEVALEGWFDTGDCMACRDGHYYISGRRSDTVIGENGENINPDTIEQAFRLEGAQMYCVLGMAGENGQELSMVVQVSPYVTEAAANKLKEQIYGINDTFPATSAIKKFYFTFDELAPPTAIKVGRAQLLKKVAEGQVKLVPFAQFRLADVEEGEESALLRQVRKIIARVLEVEDTTVTAQSHIFYDLGATSIQYFSVLSALSEEFNITSYDKNDKYCYTPKEISEYIERNM